MTSYERKELEPRGCPSITLWNVFLSVSLETSNCTRQKSFKVTNVEGNGCIRRSTGRTHWTNFLLTSPKFFFKTLPVLFVEKHEKLPWGFLRNQGKRRRRRRIRRMKRNGGQLENFFFLCVSLIFLSLTIIKLSVASTVVVTNGKMQTNIPSLQGIYSKIIRQERVVVLLARPW